VAAHTAAGRTPVTPQEARRWWAEQLPPVGQVDPLTEVFPQAGAQVLRDNTRYWTQRTGDAAREVGRRGVRAAEWTWQQGPGRVIERRREGLQPGPVIDRQEFTAEYAPAERKFLYDVNGAVFHSNDSGADVSPIDIYGRDPANGEQLMTTLRRYVDVQDSDNPDFGVAWRDQWVQRYGRDSNSRVVGDSRGRWLTINPRRFVGRPLEMLERQDTGINDREFVGVVDLIDQPVIREWDHGELRGGQHLREDVEYYGFLVEWWTIPRGARGRRQAVEERAIDSKLVIVDRDKFPDRVSLEAEARRWMSVNYPLDIDQRQGERISPAAMEQIQAVQSQGYLDLAPIPSDTPDHDVVRQYGPNEVLGPASPANRMTIGEVDSTPTVGGHGHGHGGGHIGRHAEEVPKAATRDYGEPEATEPDPIKAPPPLPGKPLPRIRGRRGTH
jgi:hypothetical protein